MQPGENWCFSGWHVFRAKQCIEGRFEKRGKRTNVRFSPKTTSHWRMGFFRVIFVFFCYCPIVYVCVCVLLGNYFNTNFGSGKQRWFSTTTFRTVRKPRLVVCVFFFITGVNLYSTCGGWEELFLSYRGLVGRKCNLIVMERFDTIFKIEFGWQDSTIGDWRLFTTITVR